MLKYIQWFHAYKSINAVLNSGLSLGSCQIGFFRHKLKMCIESGGWTIDFLLDVFKFLFNMAAQHPAQSLY